MQRTSFLSGVSGGIVVEKMAHQRGHHFRRLAGFAYRLIGMMIAGDLQVPEPRRDDDIGRFARKTASRTRICMMLRPPPPTFSRVGDLRERRSSSGCRNLHRSKGMRDRNGDRATA